MIYDIWHIQFSFLWALREVQLLLRYDQLKIYAVCSCLSGTRTRKAEIGILTLMLSAATWYYSPPNPNPKPPWKWGNPLRLSNNLGGRFLMSFLQPTESWFCIAFGCTNAQGLHPRALSKSTGTTSFGLSERTCREVLAKAMLGDWWFLTLISFGTFACVWSVWSFFLEMW